ncbi:type I restriction-modification system subunit M [Streptomyces aidingensis]|uniref:site-specific DNA-methyltransferase (adenine-specific) n=1 Tax=Streptomyces aidingensis TaxID=910347 RepID=A0A1I1MBT6_9ACTN|nr:class I SAM-dependent DNA methyltransferase [Streptomyces aidingensis]SFC82645.1 type I restriction enzyme M protein [Streptomyces aidingensis]
MSDTTPKNLANEIWQVADLLRGDYKRADYGKVILPFAVLRRLECVLEPTREAVLKAQERWQAKGVSPEPFLPKEAGYAFYNRTAHTLASIAGAHEDARADLHRYVRGFSENARLVFDKFRFAEQIDHLAEVKLLHLVLSKFADFDLHPSVVSNHEMGYAFEELIRKFAEESNETAGEHFTPREVIKLMVNLLLAPDMEEIKVPNMSRSVYDPACGTGGMLSAAEEFVLQHNPQGNVYVFGQELNPESWAICRSDMMIKNHYAENIKLGNSFSEDLLAERKFDYMLSNPPFGVEWKKVKKAVEDERDNLGYRGRFGAGTPRINDGSLLFLQHMISKMKPVHEGGSRLAIVFNGSPLFTGAAGSGESEIRRWILENDWLEAIVALPDQLFYNTGISTYFWILTNRKDPAHKGKVMLIDARDYCVKMRKSLGDKRKQISDEQIDEITRLYGEALTAASDPEHELHGKVKVFRNRDFGYQRITVERPLKLRFEVTEETLDEICESKPIARAFGDIEQFVSAFKPLVGQQWSTKAEAWDAIRRALVKSGLLWPSGSSFAKALRDVVGVRCPEGEVQTKKGEPEPDPDLRDFENVPLDEDIAAYMEREVLPHVPDAWVDHDKIKIGYEIPFTRHFYVYEPPRPLVAIDAELKLLELEIQQLIGKVAK